MEKRSGMSPKDAMANSGEPLLSVIVPISNMAKFQSEIHEWVSDSVDKGIHVILVHDRYIESSGEFLSNLALEYPGQITYCEGYFGTPGAARNRGLLEVRGKWVSFWDSDDIPKPEIFLKMVRDANQAGFEFAIGQFAERDLSNGNVTFKRTLPMNMIFAPLLIAHRPGIWRMSFKWSFVKKNTYPNRNMGEDQIYLMLSGINFRKAFFSKDVVYIYSRNFPGQLTQKTDRYENLQTVFENDLQTAIENTSASKAMKIFITLRIWISLVRRGEYRNQFKNFLRIVKYLLHLTLPKESQKNPIIDDCGK